MTPRDFANYPLRLSESASLASLEGIKADLQRVIRYSSYLHQHGPIALDFFVWEAMSVAAVIAYARCFGPGVRHSLPKNLFEQAPDHLSMAHEYFIALRSKHIAHSVNDFEENVPVAQIGSHFQSSSEIEHLHVCQSWVVGLASDEPELLSDLAAWVAARVSAMIVEEKRKLLPLVHAIPLEDIKSSGSWGPTGSSKAAVKVRRGQP